MIAIPFVYFTILLILIIRKNKAFDVSAALVSLYVLTSLFAILIDVFDLYNSFLHKVDIHLLPTFVYCFFITLTIYPFYKFKSLKIKQITIIRNQKLFDYIVYLYFGVFIFMILFFYKDIIYRFALGDFALLRSDLSKGGLETSQTSFTGFKRSFSSLVRIFAEGSSIMLLFYFYSISFLNKSKLFNALILFGSFSVIISGILGIDRSKSIYYILTFYLMMVLFKPFIHKKQRRAIIKVIIVFGTLIIMYIAIVTIARFGNQYTGTRGGIITYGGQPFIHFCEFFEKLDNPKISFHRVFPVISGFFSDSNNTNVSDWNQTVYNKSGIKVSVFATYLGMLMVDIGKFGAFVFSLFFYFISRVILKRRRLDTISFDELIFFYILVLIPLLGIISYYYSSFARTLLLWFFVIVALRFKYKLKV